MKKSEAEEREKRARNWGHTYVFLMSLLLVSNDINHHGNFEGKSRVTRCEKIKSRITLLYPIMLHAANMGPITYHAENLGPITPRLGKPVCHPVKESETPYQADLLKIHYISWLRKRHI